VAIMTMSGLQIAPCDKAASPHPVFKVEWMSRVSILDREARQQATT